MSASPPSGLRRFLERSLPSDVRDGIVGDLDEVYVAAQLAMRVDPAAAMKAD